jgi:pimeloyl-ACP methyl ester carboxylesterase
VLEFALASPLVALARIAEAAAPGFVQFDAVFPDGGAPAQRALIVVPERTLPLPTLVLLHGHKQSTSQLLGARAWRDDAGLLEAYDRLRRPPLAALYPRLGLLRPEQVELLNRELGRQPFAGLLLACPYTPPPYSGPPAVGASYASWMAESFLPATRRLGGSDTQPTGLAGVSMGGQLALEVLIARPDLFTAFTGLQIAIGKSEVTSYAARLEGAFARLGRPVAMQIHTSTNDPYREANERLHTELVARGIVNTLQVSPGPHNGTWLREVGALETLFFHDRMLRR